MEITRERRTWVRWDSQRMRQVTSRPWVWTVYANGEALKCCDTKADAVAWAAENAE